MGDVMLPVLKDTKDPHYRYKMPKLTVKVEGSGNGIKTVLTNIGAVAKSLYRPPSYPTKYFGCELGAQVTMNNDIFVVNGSHDSDRLLNLLYSFIRKFVLCPKCNNPETSLTVEKGNIKQKCIACGHSGMIPKSLHRLTTFIINHPPEATTLSVNNTKTKSSKTDKKSKNKSGSPTNGSSSPTNAREEAEEIGLDQNEDGDDFGDEFSSEVLSERREDIGSDAKENANIFYELVKHKRDEGLLSDTNVQKELLEEAKRLDIKDKSTLILSELLFTENMFDEIDKHRILLLRFCNQNKKAQKYLLGGYEKLVGDVYKEKLFNSSMKIMKQFYDKDIVEEETILEWANKESKKYVSKEMNRKIHEKVAPLIKWLKEAEEEEESDQEDKPKLSEAEKKAQEVSEEDDDDELFEFSHRVSGIQIEEVKPTAVQKSNGDSEHNGAVNEEVIDGEDIDIDEI